MKKVAQTIPQDRAHYREIYTRFHLELGLIHHHFNEDKIAADYFKKAQDFSGFKWDFTGALGKRTKFQQNDTAQLVVAAESK